MVTVTVYNSKNLHQSMSPTQFSLNLNYNLDSVFQRQMAKDLIDSTSGHHLKKVPTDLPFLP